MAIRKPVTISLSPELLAFAESLLASGRYGTISEVMRAALRHLQEHELEFVSHSQRQTVGSRHSHSTDV